MGVKYLHSVFSELSTGGLTLNKTLAASISQNTSQKEFTFPSNIHHAQ